MSEKKQVRGLLDVVAAELEGAGWEPGDLSPLGLGLGATREAERWARIGHLVECLADLEARLGQPKKKRGRPSKHPYDSINCRRAYKLWAFAHGIVSVIEKKPFNPSGPVKMTTKHLIELAKLVEEQIGVPRRDRLFTSYIDDSLLQQSVARGRKTLEIDNEWRSKVCEKMASISSQTT